MKNLFPVLCLVVVAALMLPAAAQVPDEFALYQNNPNPFCNASGGSATQFQFSCPESAFVTLQVMSPDTTSAVANLVSETMLAGNHSVLWDGRDDGGVPLPLGDYPYVMTAYIGRPPVFDFADTLMATIECLVVPVDDISWGRVKAGYQEVESTRGSGSE